jgi:outer membrane protein assembly factor BamD
MLDFLRQFPNSKYDPEAQKIATECKHRLAEHELYAASFYAKREKWYAVVGRLQSLLSKYSGAGYDEKALFELHHAYLKLNQRQKADDTLRKIIERFPGTGSAERAQKLLGS